MKDYIKDLAKEAGFSIWENESWGPGPGNIDWSSNYDNELQTLVDLLIQKLKGEIEHFIVEEHIYDVESEGYNKGINDCLYLLRRFQLNQSMETPPDLIDNIKSRLKREYIDNPRDSDPWAFGHNVGYNGAITDILFILSKEFKNEG